MGEKFPCARQVVISLLAAAALAACGRAPDDPQSAHTNSSRATASMGAAPASAAAATQRADADAGAGRTIAMKGDHGGPACMSCHGANGEGNAQAGVPRLAGLGRAYIEHQLDSYADGNRAQPVMTPVAGGLTPQQRAAVAAFYSTLGTAAPGPAAPPANAPELAVRGDEKRGLQACAKCHGVQGVGDGGANPSLAGQNAQYLMNAIAEWRDGSRHNDASGQMAAIAKALDDGEVRQLALYYAGLPPPAPRNRNGTQQGSAPAGGAQAQGPGGAASHPAQTTRQRPTAPAGRAR